MNEPISALAGAAASGAVGTPSGSGDDLGQADFLELMIAQLKAQDPFKPMESGEFMGQLAQFGTVSGIQGLQDSFENLSGSLRSLQALQASTLVGRDVLIDSNQAMLPATGSLNGAVVDLGPGTNATLTISDGTGQRVQEFRVTAGPTGRADFAWNGLDATGTRLPAGRYTVQANTFAGTEPIAARTLVEAAVDSVTLDQSGPGLKLNLFGLGSYSADDIAEIK